MVITFEDLKKIVLKNKEFWQQAGVTMDIDNTRSRSRGKSGEKIPEPSQDNSFPFSEFVNAFRVSTKALQIQIIILFFLDRRKDWLPQDRRE